MSAYQNELEAYQLRVQTLEATLREREAQLQERHMALQARDARVRELEAKANRNPYAAAPTAPKRSSHRTLLIVVAGVAATFLVAGMVAYRASVRSTRDALRGEVHATQAELRETQRRLRECAGHGRTQPDSEEPRLGNDPPSPTRNRCGCSPSDLACHMGCSVR